MSAPQPFDWPALMRLGLSHLGLRPAEFWALTPVELRLMLGPLGEGGPMLGAGLDALMAAYPDKKKGAGDG